MIEPGNISFELVQQDEDWSSNDQRYTFGPVAIPSGSASVEKLALGGIRAVLKVRHGSTLTWETTLPPLKARPYSVSFSWDAVDAGFSINGQSVTPRKALS
jgi:hypothetical protein